MIRQKCNNITDERLVEFLKSNEKREALMKAFDLQFHESEQVYGVGFKIRDILQKYMEVDHPGYRTSATMDKCIPFAKEFFTLAFPESEANTNFLKFAEILDKGKFNAKIHLAMGIYFLNHYKGGVMAETVYNW
jgi:hypothetical protein